MTLPNLRVAILGGGLAGATLLRGLIKHSHLHVDIFESRPEFKEEGAGIGLQSNALKALKAIDSDLLRCLEDAGAVDEHCKMAIGVGPLAGTELDLSGHGQSIKAETFKTVGRHAFLTQLLRNISQEQMHSNKRLTDLIPRGEGYELVFADGSKAEYDIVIGADGINGRVREFVLGDDPSAAASYAGWWHMFAVAPLSKVRDTLGDVLINPEKTVQWCMIGEDGQFILHDYIHAASAANLIIVVRSGEEYKPSSATGAAITKEELLETYKAWPEHYAKGYINLLTAHAGQPLKCWPMMEHTTTACYAKDSLAIMGDAAHAMAPWQGSGAGVAIEDAFVLSTVLGQVRSRHEVSNALRAYDQVRRPRAQAIVKSSCEAGKLMSGLTPGVGLDKKKLEQGLQHKWDFIHDYDAQEQMASALTAMGQTA